MAKIFGVELAPLNVPLKRRLQTLAVAHYVAMFLLLPVIGVLLPVYLLFTRFWWAVPLYLVWFCYDFNTSRRGSRPAAWLRKSVVWRYFRDYFPASLVKTAELDPDRNYIFGSHPHGLLSCGAMASFATESTDFSKTFPGITPHMCTLVGQFWFPLRREYTMLLGACEVSKQSLDWVLTKMGKGQAAVIVVGGAEEALDAHPGRFDLTLKKRRGFVRLALQYGVDLVPVFTFGENDLYLQVPNPPGSKLRNFQIKMKNILGFSPPIFHGRGIFNYTLGILPYRKRIVTVIGKPIRVEKAVAEPTTEEIENLHEKYVDGLRQLFEENKKNYGIAGNVHLNFV